MASAKPISLDVVASQVSNLCFEVGGIVQETNAHLGSSVDAFDFSAFYTTLGAMPTVAGHPARLLYDVATLEGFVKKYALFKLRAEPTKAAMSKAVNGRANAFYAKYANAPAIATRMTELYAPAKPTSKYVRLGALQLLSTDHKNALASAYVADGRTGVVRATQSVLDSTLQGAGGSVAFVQDAQDTVTAPVSQTTFQPLPSADQLKSFTFAGASVVGDSVEMGNSVENSSTEDVAVERQTIVNTDYGYRAPFFENAAHYERAQISLIDEQFAQFMATQNYPYLLAVFANELSVIDSDVYRTQVAYLNTILMSPVKGVVTGIYKNPGDAVSPGETVLRVENNDEVLFVARLVYRGPIAIGSTMTVSSALFDSSGPGSTFTGSVISARGLSGDDQWEVIAQCSNLDSTGNTILPFGYRFDYDDTVVTIS